VSVRLLVEYTAEVTYRRAYDELTPAELADLVVELVEAARDAAELAAVATLRLAEELEAARHAPSLVSVADLTGVAR
jgi:hypothetical protein